ncbi:MAG: ATP synthase F1 subunit delta [Candidatus Caenarcaniphilales bacterium]|nr:ATP synthase F1 subunit delta [Candidatus Caenarcaniphilales bacterium]
MSKSAQVKGYAKALFELIENDQELSIACSRLLADIADSLNDSSDLRLFVADPIFPTKLKIDTLQKLFPDLGEHVLVLNTIKLIADHRKLYLLSEFARHFLELVDSKSGDVKVSLSAASHPTEEEKQITHRLIEDLIQEKVRLHYEVDPQILAGYILQTKNFIYDYSLRGQINRMRRHLLND